MADDNTLPAMDDMVSNAGPSEQELLDAVMANSPIMDEVGIPLPNEEEIVEDPEEVVEEEDPEATESELDEEEEYEEEGEEAEGEDGAEAPTQEPEVYTAEDLDLDAKVSVKIDGEEMEVSFGDLLKGYQTDAHLSKKGRELGEAQKALDEEREAKLKEVESIAAANVQMLSANENAHAKHYHAINQKIAEAKENGDTYELPELREQLEDAKQNYWKAKQNKDQLIQKVGEQKQAYEQQQLEQQLAHFQEAIPEMIPDFSDEVATQIREFALEEGIAEGLLDSVVDPTIVKFIDDYRRLKQGVNKGAAKRKAVPAKKAIPAKKAPSKQKKTTDAEKMRKARAFKEDASQEDQMAFLRDYASKSLSNI